MAIVAIDSSTSVKILFTKLLLINLDNFTRSSDLDWMVERVLHTNIPMEVVCAQSPAWRSPLVAQ